MYYPEFTQFADLASQGNLIPVCRELPGDLDTPVSVYLKLRGAGESFLLESVEGGEQLARYSFIGTDVSRLLTLRDGSALVREGASERELPLAGQDPLTLLHDLLSPYQAVSLPGLPRFSGGAVGFLSYDLARDFEPLPADHRTPVFPNAIFLLADLVVAFDHVKHRIVVIANAHVTRDARSAYEAAISRIDDVVARLRRPVPAKSPVPAPQPSTLASNVSQADFERMVRDAQEHIAAGDIFQIVLSQRFQRRTSADAFAIYRALRSLNPSPYMFLLDFGMGQLIGASPEALVRLEDGAAQLNPIAGTRPRGANEAEDARLERELLADPKERAEHVMLVDLGRNDLGRVCQYGTVKVSQFMDVQRYSHVMHLVSHVDGKLRTELSAFDLLRACFPAGTVSGAPKVRAMEIIQELEPDRRGPYAGAVGYFGFPVRGQANMDFCITIRTIRKQGDLCYIQAGAGIVADSEPEREHVECVNKARALSEAIRLAEETQEVRLKEQRG